MCPKPGVASSNRHQLSMSARFMEEHMRRIDLLFAAAAFCILSAPALAEIAADEPEVAPQASEASAALDATSCGTTPSLLRAA